LPLPDHAWRILPTNNPLEVALEVAIPWAVYDTNAQAWKKRRLQMPEFFEIN
jgi:hypothetical protein